MTDATPHTTPPTPEVAELLDRYGAAGYAENVRALVTRARFEHVLRVAQLAYAIGQASGFTDDELRQVVQAAVLHDAARDLTPTEMFELAPAKLAVESRNPLALHGRAARVLAARWGVTDEVVLGAVEGHVFGVPLDHLVGMAVYVADVSEEGRGVNETIRELAQRDLPEAYKLGVKAKIAYLHRCGKEVHPETLEAYRAAYGVDYVAGSDVSEPDGGERYGGEPNYRGPDHGGLDHRELDETDDA